MQEKGVRFSPPSCLILIMFILTGVLEVQWLSYMELSELIALRTSMAPWLKLPKRFVNVVFCRLVVYSRLYNRIRLYAFIFLGGGHAKR